MTHLNVRLVKTLLSSALMLTLTGCVQKAPIEMPPQSNTNIPSKPSPRTSSELDSIQSKFIEAQKSNILSKLSNSVIICSVDNIPITMGDYRKSFKEQQEQLQASLSVSPEMKEGLLAMAKERNISLTEPEKARLVDAARNGQGKSPKAFAKVLESNNVSATEFKAQVLELGLAFKVATKVIEERILKQLIERELLISAAKAEGLTKQAIDGYIKVKQAPDYRKTLRDNGITEADAHNKIVANQLCRLMISKIQSNNPVTDKEIKQFYDLNKSELKHGPRIRFSQIVIACPQADTESVASIKTRLQQSNPQMSNADLDKAAVQLIKEQKKRAENILQQATRGADFTSLANLNTQDATAHQAKNGGDIGFQNEADLSKPLQTKLLPLKVGQVYPELIESPFGYHVIKVTAKEPAGELPYKDCKERISQLLKEQKDQLSLSTWLEAQLSKAKIAVSPEFQALPSTGAEAKK